MDSSDVVFKMTANASSLPVPKTFITEGTKFRYQNLTLSGRGPLLRSVVLLALHKVTNMTLSYEIEVNYTQSRKNGPLFSMQQNEWVIHGWSKCNKECGGGKQHVLLKYLKMN